MPTSYLKPISYDLDGLILASPGYDLLSAVQTLDDSKFVYNDALSSVFDHSDIRYAPDDTVIPSDADITAATIHFRASVANFIYNPILANESTWFAFQDTYVAAGAFADYFVTADPTGTTGHDVFFVRNIFAFPNDAGAIRPIAANQIQISFLEWIVDWTPHSPGRIATWVAPAWPPTCGVPPLRRFKPFDFIDRSAVSPDDVTALYAAKFGQPPSGYNIWLVWRALNDDLWPNEDSPIEGYIVP